MIANGTKDPLLSISCLRNRHWIFRSIYIRQSMLHEYGPLPEIQIAGKKK
jgi:hypothetical protein